MNNNHVTNYKCYTCKVRIPKHRPLLRCWICQAVKHYKCNSLSKNEALSLLVEGHANNWSCFDCISGILPIACAPDNDTTSPTLKSKRDRKFETCVACNKPTSDISLTYCHWCDNPCHSKCVKQSLGCLNCCVNIIPGYFYEARELIGRYYDPDIIFNPYDSNLLTNQIHTGHTIDDNDSPDDDMFTDLISEHLNNCNYQTPKQTQPAKSDELRILSLNIRSLTKHIDYLKENIDHFGKFDVICLNETSCNTASLANGINDLILEGFHTPLIQNPHRTSNRGGGLAIYVSTRVCEEEQIELLNVKPDASDDNCTLECMFVKIKLKMINNGFKNYIIGNFYRSPSASTTTSLEQLDIALNKLDKHKDKHIVLVGDFNIDLLKHERDNASQTIINSTVSNNFCQVISRPTRITDHSATLIDHIYTNQIHNVCKTGIITHDISDHLATYITIALYDRLNSKHMINKTNMAREQHRINDQNLETFSHLLNAEDWDDVLNEQLDTQQKFDLFNSKYTALYNKAFSVTDNASTRRKTQRNNPKPWILPWLEEACDRKNQFYADFIKNPSENNKNKYQKMDKFVKKHIKAAKRKYYKSYFNKHCSNSRKQWQMINSLLNRTKPKNRNLTVLDADNNLIKDPREVAESFNKYFANIAESLKTTSNYDTSITNHKSFLAQPVSNSMFIRPTDPSEINKIITELKNKTTSDYKIPALKMATLSHRFNATLAEIVNLSFVTGVFPSQMKIAKVIPIHKSGSKKDISNYRPISLLSSFSKIFEKIMHNRVSNFLEGNKILYDRQFGFRAGRSCEQALLTANNEILSALNKKQIALLLLIDFSKAFDMVDHDILLDKLDHYGIRGIANDWFKSYLCDRKQSVCIGGKLSTELVLKYSVPQGSILGPLLFVIYINDIPNISKFAKFILYADDANIIITGDNFCEIMSLFEELAQNLVKWVGVNGLALNLKKTNYMIFSRARNLDTGQFNPRIAGTLIEHKRETCFLGVLMDDRLTWSKHIGAIKSKMSRFIGVIFKLKSIIPISARLTIYNSLVQSHMNYCSLIWGTSCKSNIEKLFSTQKKAIRGVMPGFTRSYYKDGKLPTHTKNFFTENKLLTVHNIILKNIVLFFHRLLQSPSTLPLAIVQLIPPDAPNPMDTIEPDYNSSWYTTYSSQPFDKTIFFKGPILFNDIVHECPEILMPHSNKQSLIKSIKKHILNFQKLGDDSEWASVNFKLIGLTGLRRSKRIAEQTQP